MGLWDFKPATLTAQCEREMDCPKEIVMWNYYDHEHLVGTHYKLYDKVRVLAERDGWALLYRSKRLPLLPIYSSGLGFQFIENNVMYVFHKDSLGFLLELEVHFQDLPNDRSRIKAIYRINTHPIFKLIEPLFRKIFKGWFDATWSEDAPMRLRRWKVHKLGFRDFHGVDYINKKLPKPTLIEVRKYEFRPPIQSSSHINTARGERRPFRDSVELGYND